MGNAAMSKVLGPEAKRVIQRPVDISASGSRETIVFAGGCFWGVELVFQRVPGVVSTEVGYCQGIEKNPKYEDVCTGASGYVEAVKVCFDTTAIKLDDLLAVFWDIHDPTQLNRQGNDVGLQYRSGIYFTTESQQHIATRSKEELQELRRPRKIIYTEIMQLRNWYTAEEYHQRYLERGGQSAEKRCCSAYNCYGPPVSD